jgi:hypothetical protein
MKRPPLRERENQHGPNLHSFFLSHTWVYVGLSFGSVPLWGLESPDSVWERGSSGCVGGPAPSRVPSWKDVKYFGLHGNGLHRAENAGFLSNSKYWLGRVTTHVVTQDEMRSEQPFAERVVKAPRANRFLHFAACEGPGLWL